MSHDRTTTATVYGRPFAALLFDMDGTLLSSVASAERCWTRWAIAKGIDPAYVLSIMHGVRAVDTIRGLGIADPEGEAARLTEMEMDDVDDIVPLAGAVAFTAALPPERWAIVTSAPRLLAERRLAAAGLPPPAVFVAAEDITHGKPAPDGYLLAARRLGVDPAACLVLEDAAAGLPPPAVFVAAEDITHGKPAPDGYLLAARRLGVDPAACLVLEDAAAGIAAGRAAGAEVLVLTATHGKPLATDCATVKDYTGLVPESDADGIRIRRA